MTDYRNALLDHAEEQLDAEWHPAQVGVRELDPATRRALTAPRDEVHAWAKSARHAVREWAMVRDEGASLRSTCDPARANRVQTSADPSLGGREHKRIEKVRNVSKALDAATDRVLDIARACPHVTPAQARAVFELRVLGHSRVDHVALRCRKFKGTYTRRDPVTLDTVVMAARAELGLEDLERRHVRAICSHFLFAVETALVASGEMKAPVRPAAQRRGFAVDPGGRLRAALAANGT